MEYTDTGRYELDVSKIPIIPVMQRALHNKVFNIDVFINENKLTIVSNDLSGNVLYLLQEQNTNEMDITEYKSYEATSTNFEITEDEINELMGPDMDLDLEDLGLDDLDFYTEEDEEEETYYYIKPQKGQGLEWNTELEEPKRDVLNMDAVLEDIDRSYREQIDGVIKQGESAFAGEIQEEKPIKKNQLGESTVYDETNLNEDPQMSDKVVQINVGNQVCRFGTTVNFLKSLSLFKKVVIEVKEEHINLISAEDMTIIKFPKVKSFVDLEKYNSMIRQIKWERFPAKTVKSIIPVIDKIEENPNKQKLVINKGKLYVFSDIIAVSSTIKRTVDDYVLTADMLRLMKYATSTWSNVYIGNYERGLAFNIDGLIVVFPLVNKDIPTNIVDLLNEDKFITQINYDKQFAKAIELAKIIGGDKVVTIELKENEGYLMTDRMRTILKTTSPRAFRFNLSLDNWDLAKRIASIRNPVVNFYLLNGNKIVMMLINKNMKVVLEGTNFEYLD